MPDAEPQFDFVSPISHFVAGGNIATNIRRETMPAKRLLEIIQTHPMYNGSLPEVQEFVQSQPQPGACLEINTPGYALLIYCVHGG